MSDLDTEGIIKELFFIPPRWFSYILWWNAGEPAAGRAGARPPQSQQPTPPLHRGLVSQSPTIRQRNSVQSKVHRNSYNKIF